MKIRSLVAAANIGFMFLLVVGNAAEAAELKVLSAGGMQSVMEQIFPAHFGERRTISES
jgi:ABC-type molybdate transport system substrate-binding protein